MRLPFRTLAALPERQFQLIRPRYYDGKSSDEIAAEQGRKRVAVAVNLHRICKGLRREIDRHLQQRETMRLLSASPQNGQPRHHGQ